MPQVFFLSELMSQSKATPALSSNPYCKGGVCIYAIFYTFALKQKS